MLSCPAQMLFVLVRQQGDQVDPMAGSEATDEICSVQAKSTRRGNVRQRLGYPADVHRVPVEDGVISWPESRPLLASSLQARAMTAGQLWTSATARRAAGRGSAGAPGLRG